MSTTQRSSGYIWDEPPDYSNARHPGASKHTLVEALVREQYKDLKEYTFYPEQQREEERNWQMIRR